MPRYANQAHFKNDTGVQESHVIFLFASLSPSTNASPKEAPEEEQHDDGSYSRNWSVLLEKQLPVDADCRALVLGRVLAQPAAHVAHLVQAVAAVKQVVDVLGHGFVHILELVVESVHVVLRPAILVEFLRALQEAFELGVGVRAQARVEVVFALVRALELLAHVVEIGEGEFLRVAAFGDGDKDEVVVHRVAARGG
jgi:hypothetical protein